VNNFRGNKGPVFNPFRMQFTILFLTVAELSYSSSLPPFKGFAGVAPSSTLISLWMSSVLMGSVFTVTPEDETTGGFTSPLVTGELVPEGVWFTVLVSSSQEDVDEPDSSSVDNVGGWSPT